MGLADRTVWLADGLAGRDLLVNDKTIMNARWFVHGGIPYTCGF